MKKNMSIQLPNLVMYELYNKEDISSEFFDSMEELNLYRNACGNCGKVFILEFYYSKDGFNNVIKETDENAHKTSYRIIDEDTCVAYTIDCKSGKSISKFVNLVYWPIIDALIERGISFDKDKCKIK